MFELTGKKAVITGGGSGIGKAIAILFAQQGADVHVIELRPEAAQETITAIEGVGGQVKAYGCDVSQASEVQKTFAAIGALDILVNNAGIAHVGNLETTSEEDLERVYRVNVKGAYNCLQAAVKAMKENNTGVILNMASVAALVGISDRFAYSMSKGAIHAMTMSVAKDYLGANIRCNSISPARARNASSVPSSTARVMTSVI